MAPIIVLYFVFVNAGYIPYAEVCSKGKNSAPDNCAYYDIISALIGRALVFLDEHNGAIAAFAGIMVGAFTFTLWKSTEKLWEEARSQRRESRRAVFASIVSARATRKSANATVASVTQMRENAERELRAYLSSGISDQPDIRVGGLGRLVVRITNTGRTPAYQQRHVTAYCIRPFPDPQAVDLALPDHEGFIINPGDWTAIDHQLDHPLTRDEYDAIADGSEYRLYLFGRVTYVDAFEIVRHLHYRYEIGGAEQLRVGALHLSAKGNTAD